MPLAAAVVGTGFIGPVHVEALRRLGVPVLGVLGSSPQKSREAADKLGSLHPYDSFDQLLNDDRVQVVHIASPNRYHFEQCRQALLAGRHVVCEKPLAMTSFETNELVRLAAGRPKQAAAVCYNVRSYPLNHEARTRLQELGPLHHVTGSYVQDWLLNETDFNWRVLASEGGPLRAVADIGTHWLDLIQFVTGHGISAVCADLQTCLPERLRPAESIATFNSESNRRVSAERVAIDTEDFGSVLLRFDNGARGAFHVSQVTAGRKNCLRYEIAAQNGALAWSSEQPDELWLGHRGKANEILIRDPAMLSAAAQSCSDYPGGHVEGFPDTFKQLFKAIYRHIALENWNAPAAFPTFADGHREVLLGEAILRSHRERRWITLE